MFPWEDKIYLAYEVPVFPTGNKNVIVRMGSKRFIKKTTKAEAFSKNVALSTMQICRDIEKNPPASMPGIKFPLAGKDYPLRLDVHFLFSLSPNGRQRMKQTDVDNLIKGFMDGLKGVLMDDDRHIWEMFISKGDAPTDKADMILATLSRSGCRTFPQTELLAKAMPCLPPWTFQLQTGLIKPKTKPGPGIHGIG